MSEQAIAAACEKQGSTPETVTTLILDSAFSSATLSGLDACVALAELSAIGCAIASLDGFPALPALRKLDVSDNRVAGATVAALAGCAALEELMLGGNKIASLDDLKPLAEKGVPLVVLDLANCPCAEGGDEYRDAAFAMFPKLQVLDGRDKAGDDVELDDSEEDDEDEDEEEELEDEEDEDEDEDEDADDEDEDDEDEDDADEDEDEDEDEDSDDDDDEPGLAALVGNPLEDDEGDFEAESDPESEDFDDEEDDEEDEDAGAAKKPRVE